MISYPHEIARELWIFVAVCFVIVGFVIWRDK